MKLGGLQKQTLIDYPGKLACTVFTAGCNFRCPFCYNPHLVLNSESKIGEKEFFEFLKERKDFLDAICICGGEPTIHKDLINFIKKIKSLGLAIKLDTNGSNPNILEELLKNSLIDHVALDIKAPKEKYVELAGINIAIENIEHSIAILRASDIDHEFRTTIVPTLLNKTDIIKIAEWLAPAKKYYLQNFQPKTTIDPKLEKVKPLSKEQLEDIQSAIKHHFEICEVRM